MLLKHVAVVSEIPNFPRSELDRVSAAIQKQVLRDFAPVWETSATVDAFGKLEDIPVDSWPILIVEDVQGAAGVHLDKSGQPFALVENGRSWSLTASHECLEMLADPFGNRTVAGYSPKKGQGRVEFLVEVCDPCESEAYAYTSNGILVSDFYTPSYFDPTGSPSVRYSFTGAITSPREVLEGGYLSWHDLVSDHWFQEFVQGGTASFKDLNKIARNGACIREIINGLTPEHRQLSRVKPSNPALTQAASLFEEVESSSGARASSLRSQIAALVSAARKGRKDK
jgi:hypothetical protein